MWNSPIPEKRWTGQRQTHKGAAAFESIEKFEAAAVSELEHSFNEQELANLGRLIKMDKKLELELFVRTHGANPLFDPQEELDVAVGVPRADEINLSTPPSEEALDAILDGRILHVLFQAGEASRFQEGPFHGLNPILVAKKITGAGNGHNGGNGHTNGNTGLTEEMVFLLDEIYEARSEMPADVGTLLVELELGPKQPLLIRAAVRRAVHWSISSGRIKRNEAAEVYKRALAQQKLLFFVNSRSGGTDMHDEMLRKKYKFFGFDPRNIMTIEQELSHGFTVDERGRVSLLKEEWAMDAAGHLYALIQSARSGGFTTYTESGRPIKPMEVDALSYVLQKGAKIMSIIRINDMDRHSTEIINPKALAYALKIFSKGYVNAIETVANPHGQKGGVGTTFGDPNIHVLTETHENSFPSLSRPFEAAVKRYLEESQGRHPAYNAMRQWADIAATRQALREFGARIVFVPRQKTVDGQSVLYLGADMPMGDLSLLFGNYKSRTFQFIGPNGQGLLIHDMKTKENLPMALEALLNQLEDPLIVATAEEICTDEMSAFDEEAETDLSFYGAPTPEFEDEVEDSDS